jgi:superfamily I DNA/RNA helicase
LDDKSRTHPCNDSAEAEYIVHQIEKRVGGTSYFSLDSGRVEADDEVIGQSFADFAVLYRLGAQSQLLVEAFQRSGMPYQTVGQTPLVEHQAVREVLSYLWLSHNPDAVVYLGQLLNFKKAESLGPFLALAAEQGRRPGELLQDFEQLGVFKAAQKKQLKKIVPFLNELRADRTTEPVSRLIERVWVFITETLARSFDEQSAERVQQLGLRAVSFGTDLAAFLEAMVLQKETDAYDPRADRVTLMTLHASKGLEFPVVFIVGCEEGIIPYQRKDEAVDVEEERRLFYVGMTRAQKKLILTRAKSRVLFGQKQANEPSRFLADIEETLKELKEMAARKVVKEKDEVVQLTLF